MQHTFSTALLAAGLFFAGSVSGATVILDQDFDSPVGWQEVVVPVAANDASQQQVNDLYGAQTPGVTYAQTATVETLLITGSKAFGTGYDDPTGEAGDYLLGMLAGGDLLGIAFDIGSATSFTMNIDITSIDINGAGGPFNPAGGRESEFQFSLFDNPGGTASTGIGASLDSVMATTTLSAAEVVDFTTVSYVFDASGVTNGNVILQVDLVGSTLFEYAGFDNLQITVVPLPGAVWLFLSALAGLVGLRARTL